MSVVGEIDPDERMGRSRIGCAIEIDDLVTIVNQVLNDGAAEFAAAAGNNHLSHDAVSSPRSRRSPTGVTSGDPTGPAVQFALRCPGAPAPGRRRTPTPTSR